LVKTDQILVKLELYEQSNSLSTAHMSSQTAYQQLNEQSNSLSTAYQQPINSSYEQSMSSQ